ncbi:FAD-dependent oxidoreductase [Arcicella sp. LKC2W]|uniref:glycerol-3-phosphate dehydrogenase/oxidase n=1 Tax=Arcicella sp. LKC2W TaxID=2984198 RepID=UPI002B20E3D6|nr:FAD-dependent oxidoreductase [Arcicella sp. LKC2W]MEA5458266.1 FAD-dependent oxidoreductase [Arcicella sp. LKC2W]
MNRQEQLKKLQNTTEFDICIIGGGATGAGIALDAVMRGLKVMLIDKNDFAAQTSSKSTKLIHGGVRYLEQAVKKLDWEQYKMVRKALREREILLQNAPHLSRPLALLTPCFNFIEGIYYTIGMKMYEWIAGSQNIAKSEWLSKKTALKLIPELKSKRMSSAVLYYDGQLDDARYCLALLQTAEAKGATILNYTQAVKFNKNEDSGRLKSLIVSNLINGTELTINAKVFINATGPFADSIRTMASSKLKPRIKVSRGAHIVLPRSVMQGDTAILVPKTDDGRVIFMIPWQDQVLVGTTDEADELSENPKLEDYEKTYLLEYVNRYLDKNVTPDQVKSGFAGLRPLLQAQLQSAMNSDTKSLVRDHEVEIDRRSKLVSIMGGKWTTYRIMAKDTLDEVYKEVLKKETVKCTTEHQVLFGGENYRFEDWENLVNQYQVSEIVAKHLLKKYGVNAQKVLQLTENEPVLKELLNPEHPFIKAEIKYVIQSEMAQTIDDVLERRLGLRLRDEAASKAVEPYVKEVLLENFN